MNGQTTNKLFEVANDDRIGEGDGCLEGGSVVERKVEEATKETVSHPAGVKLKSG